jgi:hypothetical protein
MTLFLTKATMRPRQIPHRPTSGPSYMFHIRRAGKGRKRIIGNDEFDLLALVAMDIRTVAYLKIGPTVLQTIHLRVPHCASGHGNKSRGNIDQYPIGNAVVGMFA